MRKILSLLVVSILLVQTIPSVAFAQLTEFAKRGNEAGLGGLSEGGRMALSQSMGEMLGQDSIKNAYEARAQGVGVESLNSEQLVVYLQTQEFQPEASPAQIAAARTALAALADPQQGRQLVGHLNQLADDQGRLVGRQAAQALEMLISRHSAEAIQSAIAAKAPGLRLDAEALNTLYDAVSKRTDGAASAATNGSKTAVIGREAPAQNAALEPKLSRWDKLTSLFPKTQKIPLQILGAAEPNLTLPENPGVNFKTFADHARTAMRRVQSAWNRVMPQTTFGRTALASAAAGVLMLIDAHSGSTFSFYSPILFGMVFGPEAKDFYFKTGYQLVATNEGAFIVRPGSEPQLFAKGAVEAFPQTRPDGIDNAYKAFNFLNLVEVWVGGRLYVVTKFGKIVNLGPADGFSSRQEDWLRGVVYKPVSIKDRAGKAKTFLVRGDGAVARVDSNFHDFSKESFDTDQRNGVNYLAIGVKGSFQSESNLDELEAKMNGNASGRMAEPARPIRQAKAKPAAPTEARASFGDGKIKVEVRDDGIYAGLSPKEMKKLPFISYLGNLSEIVPSLRFITHGRRNYVVISVPAEVPPGEVNPHSTAPRQDGETMVVRDDGTAVRVDFRKRNLSSDAPVVANGILKLSGDIRDIDLDHFDAEAQFAARRPRIVLDKDGDPVGDPLRLTRKNFPDLAEKIRLGEAEAFGMINDPGEAGIVDKIRTALSQNERGSAVLLGEPGTAKSQLIKSFIAKAVRGDYPEIPRTLRVYDLDALTIGQGTKYTGQFETKINALAAACEMGPSIVLLDEMSSLRGQGTHSENPNDIFQYMRTKLADGSIRALATDNPEPYYNAFGGDRAIMRRVAVVTKGDPGEETVVRYLESWAKRYGRQRPSGKVLRLIAQLSNEYSPITGQPALATELMDRAYSRLRVGGIWKPKLSEKDVIQAAIDLYGVDPAWFDASKTQALLSRLPGELDKRVVGQEWAKVILYELTRQRLAGTHDRRRPAVRAVFAGPKGQGKTELALAYAEAMNLPGVRIEMNKFAEGGVEEFRQEIARAIEKNPYSVLILDEFEKANPVVQRAVLAILDSGEMTINRRASTAKGADASVRLKFHNASIIATSNAGERYVQAMAGDNIGRLGFRKENDKDDLDFDGNEFVKAMIQDGIPDTVLDRFMAAAAFIPASKEQFKQIVRMHVSGVIRDQEKLQRRPIRIANQEGFVEYAADHFYRFGASNRIVHFLTQTFVRAAVTDAVLASKSKSAPIEIRFSADKLERSLASRPSDMWPPKPVGKKQK